MTTQAKIKVIKSLTKLDKVIKDSVVEFKEPTEDGQIGTIMGIPVKKRWQEVKKGERLIK